MSKGVLLACLIAFIVGVFWMFDNMKSAYKLIPIDAQKTMAFEAGPNWQEFKSSLNQFKVLMPTAPQHATQAVPIPKSEKKRKYDMYVSEKIDGSVFMVNVITYPQELIVKEGENVLQDVVNEIMETNPNNHLEKMERATFQGYPAIDFAIQNNEFNIDGKALLTANVLYLLTYVAKNEIYNAQEYEFFINSFHLDLFKK